MSIQTQNVVEFTHTIVKYGYVNYSKRLDGWVWVLISKKTARKMNDDT